MSPIMETSEVKGQMTPAQLSLVLQLIFVSIATGLDNCITVSSIKDYSLIGHTYKTSSGKSLMTCIISCDQDPNCYSLNYKFLDKMCELSNSTQYADLQDFVFSPDAVYFDHMTRPSGSCSGDWPCTNKGKCMNVAKAPGFKCECYQDYIGDTCKVCSSPPLGMQDGRILNHQVTASSEGWWLDLSTFKARNARLWLKSTSWVGSVLDSNPWIQISFAPEIKLITGISTQGNPSHDWFTSSYTLKYGMTGKTWHDYEREGFVEVFLGNSDGNSVVKHTISPPIKASFIRILPVTKYIRPALRLELYGCDSVEN